MQPRLAEACFLFFITLFVFSLAAAGEEDRDSCIYLPLTFSMYIQGDYVAFWGDKVDTVAYKNTLKDGFNIPRSRFIVEGKEQGIYYKMSYDAAEKRLRETFLRDEKNPYLYLSAGHIKPPFSLWFLTSQRDFNFMEQGLPNTAFGLGYRVGLCGQFFADPFTFSLSGFGPEASNAIRNIDVHGHVPLATDARITFVPIHTECTVLHFAAATVFQDTDSSGTMRFRTFPEVQTTRNYFLVDTGNIPQCKNYIGSEEEMLAILGPFSFGGEFYQTHVNRNPDDLNFAGYFLHADCFLTGEHYIYKFKEGDLQGISKIRHCYGALQLLVRYSEVNLNDGPIHGGKEDNLTLGLNWWVNKHLEFMVNYIVADTHPSANGLDRQVNILGLRCQISA